MQVLSLRLLISPNTNNMGSIAIHMIFPSFSLQVKETLDCF